MGPEPHDQPERFVREPWWRAAFWELLLRVSGTLGAIVGTVGAWYFGRLMVEQFRIYDTRLIPLALVFPVIGWWAGTGLANALLRRLRGESGRESPGIRDESGPPPE